tara:strand:- start:1356 stop:1607 length:252 start_codon:yes stop_codon:yes gene_type:complete
MSFFVYVLGGYKKSKLTTYVGYTNNIKKRIKLHNNNKGAKFTRGNFWKLLYKEKCSTRSEALSREYNIKRDKKLRNVIKKTFV